MARREELAKVLGKPIPIAHYTYLHFYNGGKLRAEFVGEPDPKDDYRSEEWILSTNRAITPGRENPPDKGFSRIVLASGQEVLLKEILEAFPDKTLGKKHAATFGSTLGLLVKIFDVGDDAHIPVHWHPRPEFSKKHLNSPYGKNEAWVVIGTRPGAKAWIGWKEDVGKGTFKTWLEAQDVEEMRRHMYEVTPKVGDVIFLRAGYVHSLGSGLCILEPQEPTDWNILAEWEGFPYGKEDAACGLKWDTALEAADFKKMPRKYLDEVVLRTPVPLRAVDGSVEEVLVPDEAKPFFWLTRLKVRDRIDMPNDRGFWCAVCVGGEGKVAGPFGEMPIRRGRSLFMPCEMPRVEFVRTGGPMLEVVCCYPPEVK